MQRPQIRTSLNTDQSNSILMSDDDEIEFIEMSASPNKRQRTEQTNQ